MRNNFFRGVDFIPITHCVFYIVFKLQNKHKQSNHSNDCHTVTISSVLFFSICVTSKLLSVRTCFPIVACASTEKYWLVVLAAVKSVIPAAEPHTLIKSFSCEKLPCCFRQDSNALACSIVSFVFIVIKTGASALLMLIGVTGIATCVGAAYCFGGVDGGFLTCNAVT